MLLVGLEADFNTGEVGDVTDVIDQLTVPINNNNNMGRVIGIIHQDNSPVVFATYIF